jgi:hypothetical protein
MTCLGTAIAVGTTAPVDCGAGVYEMLVCSSIFAVFLTLKTEAKNDY